MKRALVALVVACALASCGPPGSSQIALCFTCTIFSGGLVFDGRELLSGKAVVVRDDRIVQIVDTPFSVFGSAHIVDTSGQTLLPGLIDAHVHLFQTSAPLGDLTLPASGDRVAQALLASLRAGVTSVIDMGGPAAAVFDVRARVAAGDVAGPRVFAAGPGFAPPGGTPCTRGIPPGDTCVFVEGPEDTPRVDALVTNDGADLVHVTLDRGAGFANLTHLASDTLESMQFHAAQDGVPLAVEPSNGDDVRDAIAFGANHFATVPMDDALTGDVITDAVAADALFIPALAPRDAAAAIGGGTWAPSAFALDGYAPADVLALLVDADATAFMRTRAENAARLAQGAEDNFGRVFGANATLVAGSDAGQPGVFFGAGLHEELARWVSLGATPLQALRAATRNAAEFLGRTDVGRIAVGAKADFVIVKGDASDAISHVDEIVAVWSRGVEVDRDATRAPDAPTNTRAIGETCVFASECASGVCDARDWRCTVACAPNAGECSDGDACIDGTCVSGDGCDLLVVIDPDNDDSACDNAAACVPLGDGATRCVLALADRVQGEPCAGPPKLCAEGFACIDDADGGTCAEICDPAGVIGACANGGACVDESATWGVAAGHCTP